MGFRIPYASAQGQFKTTESGERQAEVKEAKDNRGNADPKIDEFWENNQGEVIENTTK